MLTPRAFLAAVTDSQGRIYAFGGIHNGIDISRILESVEVYDLERPISSPSEGTGVCFLWRLSRSIRRDDS